MSDSFDGLKVMVVDDSKTIRRTAETLLKKAGCEVVTAEDGFDALAKIVDNRPDVVVDIVNASQLERNLYLTLLLIKLQVNLVIALNMYDLVKARGDQIDIEGLSKRLGAQIVATTATRKEGIEDLKDAILAAIPQHSPHS